MSTSFRTSIMIISAVMLVLLAACSSEKQGDTVNKAPEPKQDQRITVAVTQDAKGNQLDATTYNGARAIQSAIYEPLVEFKEGGKLAPGLAKAWEVSEDGQTYTFHLREDVSFSDGSELDSQAVKFSLERTVANKETSSLEITRKLNNIETPDAHTVILNFKEMATQALLELSQARPFRVMSPNAVSPAGAIEGEFVKPIGTGPWQLESYKEGVETVLSGNPHYWSNAASPYKLVFRVITDPQARVLALQNGEIDIAGGEVGNIPYENLPLFENNPKFMVEQHASTMSYFMVINQNNEWLADKRVRQAINLGTDTSKMMGGQGANVSGLFQSTVPFVTKENQPAYSYDPEQAKQLLASAGYKWNEQSSEFEKNGAPLQLRLVIQTEEYPEWKEMAEIFQHQMKQIGIRVEIANMERAAYYDALWTTKEYDLLLYRTYTDAQLPYRFLSSLFYHTAQTPGVAYQDQTLTKLLDQIAGTTSPTEQQQLFDTIFQRMHEEAMTVPIYYTKQTFIHRKSISHFAFGDIEDNPVKWHQLTVEE